MPIPLYHNNTSCHHLFSIIVLIYHVIFLSSACFARFPFRHSFTFILHASLSYQSFIDQRFILVVMSPASDGRIIAVVYYFHQAYNRGLFFQRTPFFSCVLYEILSSKPRPGIVTCFEEFSPVVFQWTFHEGLRCTSSSRNTVSLLLTQSTLQSWTCHMFWGLLIFIRISSCRLPVKLLVTHLPPVLKTSVTQSHFVQSSSSQDLVVT